MWIHYIRFISVVILFVYVVIRHRKLKAAKIRRQQENLELLNYSKDEEGLFPWERDTNDSPWEIPEDATRFMEKEKIRRGQWR